MNILFWILWTSEFILSVWWVLSELKLTYLKPNPNAFLSVIYMMVALLIRFGFYLPKLSLAMVGIPAIPLACMVLIIIVAKLTGARWN